MELRKYSTLTQYPWQATMVPFSLLLSLGREGLRMEGEFELGWIKVKVCPKPWGLVTELAWCLDLKHPGICRKQELKRK